MEERFNNVNSIKLNIIWIILLRGKVGSIKTNIYSVIKIQMLFKNSHELSYLIITTILWTTDVKCYFQRGVKKTSSREENEKEEG